MAPGKNPWSWSQGFHRGAEEPSHLRLLGADGQLHGKRPICRLAVTKPARIISRLRKSPTDPTTPGASGDSTCIRESPTADSTQLRVRFASSDSPVWSQPPSAKVSSNSWRRCRISSSSLAGELSVAGEDIPRCQGRPTLCLSSPGTQHLLHQEFPGEEPTLGVRSRAASRGGPLRSVGPLRSAGFRSRGQGRSPRPREAPRPRAADRP
jgi:hypothetical protein